MNNNLAKAKSKTWIIIPAFNEARAIGDVLQNLNRFGYTNVVVVDDGSLDTTYQVAQKAGATVLHHLVNRGKGAATQTGMDAAKQLGADYAITIDADGQHDPKDLDTLLAPLMQNSSDVVLGSRFINSQQVPLLRQLANRIGNLVTFVFYGIYVSDSQSGLRAYNRRALELIKTTFDRFEFESEIIHQLKIHKLRYQELPITVYYTDYSLTKYKELKNFEAQKLFNGFVMLFRMIIRSITT